MAFLIVCLIICTTIGVPIFLLMFYLKQDYFNTRRNSDGSSEVFLTFKDFIKFYNLNQPEDEQTGYNMLPDVQLVEQYIMSKEN